MSQRVIDVTLTGDTDTDVLMFHLDAEHPDAYMVNLNSATSQNELKHVFSKLLQLLIDEEITLKLNIADAYKRDLYIDVCKEYIDDLNNELSQVRTTIQAEIC